VSYTPRQWGEQIARDCNLPDEDIDYIELAIVESVREAEQRALAAESALAVEKAAREEAEALAARRANAINGLLKIPCATYLGKSELDAVDEARMSLARDAGRTLLARLALLENRLCGGTGHNFKSEWHLSGCEGCRHLVRELTALATPTTAGGEGT
jgi:hypothetical protein